MDRKSFLPAKSYDDAVQWIFERIDYERVPPVRTSPHFQLERVRRLLQLIGSPEQRIPSVHIAGTKGKGSTAAMVESILRASDIPTGLFTSPHLQDFEERMTVSGRQPSPEELTEMVVELQQCLAEADQDLQENPPTYFEVATLLAWMYFDRNDVRIAVLETGLGGRLDCTNVCSPVVTVITNISLDHTSILGNSVKKIAYEKAGIIKEGVPLVTGVTQPEVIALCEETAARRDAPVTRLPTDVQLTVESTSRDGQRFHVMTPRREYSDLQIPLVGHHQAENAALALAAVDLLVEPYPSITPETVRRGLHQAKWPLRFELVGDQPVIILDAAHNPDAASAITETLKESHWSERPRVLIFAASLDKDIDGMLAALLPQFDHVVVTRYQDNPRSCAPEELESKVRQTDSRVSIHTAPDPEEAIHQAKSLAGNAGLILVTGSIFIGAQCRQVLMDR